VLIGNAGTAKSMYQYYFMYRLGKDSYGNFDPPKVAIGKYMEASRGLWTKSVIMHYNVLYITALQVNILGMKIIG
jgi:hypothetical protein